MDSILIKDTTRKQREEIVRRSMDCGGGCENCSSCWLGGGSPWDMYKDYIDPNFKWVNFTVEEQAKVVVAERSNNELDASKLKKEFPEVLSIKDSLIKYVFEPNRKRIASGLSK